MRITDISRKQAFLSHLIMSAGIFAILSYLIVFQWYPSFYFDLDGGKTGMAMIFFVDVILGPGLTLLVFKPNKKSLKFDMSVVLLCQLLALGWGIKSVYEERSAVTVFYLGKFTSLTQSYAESVNKEAIAKGEPGNQMLALLRQPDDMGERRRFQNEAFVNQSSEIYYYGAKFEALDNGNLNRVLSYKLDMEALQKENKTVFDAVVAYKEDHAELLERYHFYPILTRFKKAIAVFDSAQMRIVDIIDAETKLRATHDDAADFFLKRPLTN